MNLQEFINARKGEVCHHPLGKTGQCVCLIRCYVDDVLKVPQFAGVVGAKNMWSTYNPKYFQRIPNTAKGIPKEGDIVILDAFKGNPNGHVCIALAGGTVGMFPCFESNWSVIQRATIGRHGYITPKVIGWLRKK